MIKRGNKHICFICKTQFYDMGFENAQCPNCLLKNEVKNENKKLSGKNYSNKDIQKKFPDAKIIILEIIDQGNCIARDVYDKNISFQKNDLYSKGWLITLPSNIKNEKIVNNKLIINLSTPPETGLISFLETNLFKGLGEIQSKKLVKDYGFSFVRVLNQTTKQISKQLDIREKLATVLQQGWKATLGYNFFEVFLRNAGFTFSQIIFIKENFGAGIINILKDKPYSLIGIIPRFTFEQASKMFVHLNLIVSEEEEILAATTHWLKKTENDYQHTCAPFQKALKKVNELLGKYEEEKIEKYVRKHKDLFYFTFHNDNEIVISKASYDRDKNIVAEIKRIQNYQLLKNPKVFEKKDLKAGKGIDLSQEQIDAINNSIKSSVSIITGGPGSGKTTLVRALVKSLKELKLDIKLCAPTGRAAKRIAENPGLKMFDPSTIHRYLFSLKNKKKQSFDVMIVDESSMIDANLFLELLETIPNGANIIFIGDADQLPPVGPGQPFNDLIKSKVIQTSFLTGNFRQDEFSAIVKGARRVILGKEPEVTNSPEKSDLYFLEISPQDQAKAILNNYFSVLPATLLAVQDNDIQILSPMRRGDAGVTNLNYLIQSQLNQGSKYIYQKKYGENVTNFYLNDKVIVTENNYDLDVMNGDIGIIIGLKEKDIIIRFEDGKEVEFSSKSMEKVELAYAITIHKSQGSEYRAVVIPISANHSHMLTRKLIYTAITRGKEIVCLVGQWSTFQHALRMYMKDLRYTNLYSLF